MQLGEGYISCQALGESGQEQQKGEGVRFAEINERLKHMKTAEFKVILKTTVLRLISPHFRYLIICPDLDFYFKIR